MNKRLTISSGTEWEEIVGYSRAVRVDNIIEVAGTTAVDENGKVIGIDDAYEQTKYILTKINKALIAAHAELKDVIRTKIYVTDISRWQEIGRAHHEVFKEIKPACTMVEIQALINPELLVEIEVTAIVSK